MTTTLPKGVNSARSIAGTDSTMFYAPIANGSNFNIGEGDPVKVSSGVVQLADSTTAVAGIFRGVEYIDPTTKKPVMTNKFTALTSSGGTLNGDTRPLAKIEPIEGKRFLMKAGAATSLAATVIGNYYAVSAVGSVDAYGRSTCVIDATPVTVAAGMVQVVGLYREQGNNWGDLATAVEVVFPTKSLI